MMILLIKKFFLAAFRVCRITPTTNNPTGMSRSS